jgi:hypothetical protein
MMVKSFQFYSIVKKGVAQPVVELPLSCVFIRQSQQAEWVHLDHLG